MTEETPAYDPDEPAIPEPLAPDEDGEQDAGPSELDDDGDHPEGQP